MGNQGMTNWKLTALFAISLMLIAGLFSNAAIARDGAGTASVTWSHADYDLAAAYRDGNTLYEYDGPTSRLVPVPLPAGSRENQLMFSYYVTQNMAGGQVVIELPPNWNINTAADNKTGREETDDADTIIVGTSNVGGNNDGHGRYGTNLLVEVRERFGRRLSANTAVIYATKVIYATNRDGHHRTIDGGNVTSTVLNADDTADVVPIKAQTDRVTIEKIGADHFRKVTVELSNEWRSGGELVVVLRDVTTAIPSSLPARTTASSRASVTNDTTVENLPYFNAPFTVKSKKSGRPDTLDPTLIDDDGDNLVDSSNSNALLTRPEEEDADTPKVYSRQPAVRVGNILGERGSFDNDNTRAYIQYYGPDLVDRAFAFKPDDVYSGESNIDFTMTFEAKGPMYAVGTALVGITVPIPLGLRVHGDDAVGPAAITYYEDHITVTATGRVSPSGSLDAGSDAGSEFTVTDAGVVTINFQRIDKGAKVVLEYDF